MEKTILIVDDEVDVLLSLGRTLRKNGTILTAESGREGLDILEKTAVDMVISDMRMSEMNGYDFLLQVKNMYPETIRLILSGYSDKRLILQAIMDGAGRAYLPKPWKNDQLRSYVTSVFTLYDRIREPALRKVIDSIDKKFQLPDSYTQLMEQIREEKSVREISDFISRDPELSLQILKLANSSFYGIHAGSLSQAIQYIGLDALANSVLSITLSDSRGGAPLQAEVLKDLSEHSTLTSRLLHAMYKQAMKCSIPDEYASAGILHDIGKIMLVKNMPGYTSIIDEDVDISDFLESEKRTFSMTHAEFGAWLLDWWNLPNSLVESCMFHHTPLEEGVLHEQVCLLLHIADSCAQNIANKKYVTDGIDTTIMERAKINENQIKSAVSSVR